MEFCRIRQLLQLNPARSSILKITLRTTLGSIPYEGSPIVFWLNKIQWQALGDSQ